MSVLMQISSASLADDDLDALTRQLSQTIARETEIDPALAEGNSQPGEKGELVTIGAIVLTFLSSGAAVALCDVLKTYIARESSLEFALKSADGTEVSLSATNISDERIEETIIELQKIVVTNK